MMSRAALGSAQVIFIDEIDGFLRERDSHEQQVRNRCARAGARVWPSGRAAVPVGR
jgi:hypothetical protein